MQVVDTDYGANDIYTMQFVAPNDDAAIDIALVLAPGIIRNPETLSASELMDIVARTKTYSPQLFEDDIEDNDFLAEYSVVIFNITNIDTGESIYETDAEFDFENNDDDEYGDD